MKLKAEDRDGGGFTPADLRKERRRMTPEQERAVAQLGWVLRFAPKAGAEMCPEHPGRLKSACGTCRSRKSRAATAASQTPVISEGEEGDEP